jgi:GT2 family glycosyltransferase
MPSPAPDLSAIVVNHRSVRLCEAAVASLRARFAEEAISGEILVVDCASGAEEQRALSSVGADQLITLPDNRGYSGGLNAGLASARSRRLLLCNADVEFLPGCLGPLLAAVQDGRVGAAAPVQFGDRERRVFLPTGLGSSFLLDWRQARSGRPGAFERRRFARRARGQWALWQNGGATRYLAGSILMTRADVLEEAGKFDESFPFEYEETEWEDRLRAAGFALRVVARSRALHHHGSSSAVSPGAEGRAAASRAAYRRRRYGRAGGAILDWAESHSSRAAFARYGHEEIPARPGYALAASTNPSVLPFAGVSLESPVKLSALFAAAAPRLYLRTFRTSDGEPGDISEAFAP